MQQNLAARAGRWSAAHWKTALDRLAGVLRRRRRARQPRGHEDAEAGRHGFRRDEDGRQDPPGRRLPDARVRERPRPVEDGDGRRPGLPRRGRRRRPHRLGAEGRPEGALAAHRPTTAARSRRTVARRSSSSRSAATRRRPPTRCSRSSTPSRGARARHADFVVAEFGFASANHELTDDARQRLQAGRVLVAARDAGDPARRLRRARRGRACRCCSPSRACSRRSGSPPSRATSSPRATRPSR